MTVPQETAPSGASTDTASTRPSAADTGLRTDEEHACNLTELAGSSLPGFLHHNERVRADSTNTVGSVDLRTTGTHRPAKSPTGFRGRSACCHRLAAHNRAARADTDPLRTLLRTIADGPQPMRSGRWSGLTERRLTLTRLRRTPCPRTWARSDPDPSQGGTA